RKSFLSHKNRSNRAKCVPPRTTRLTLCNRQLRLLDELFLLRQQIRFFAQIKKFRRAREITNVRQEDTVVRGNLRSFHLRFDNTIKRLQRYLLVPLELE